MGNKDFFNARECQNHSRRRLSTNEKFELVASFCNKRIQHIAFERKQLLHAMSFLPDTSGYWQGSRSKKMAWYRNSERSEFAANNMETDRSLVAVDHIVASVAFDV